MTYTLTTDVAGQIGQKPRLCKLISSDTLATITTAGYLNNQNLTPNNLSPSDFIFCAYGVSQGVPAGFATLTPTISSGVITLNVSISDVTTPTIANHIATYTNTAGSLSEDPATAISGGNIQAGLSGTAGYLASFPATGSKGSFRITAVANTGDTLTTLSNAAMGQASVITIPDPGATTAQAVLSQSNAPTNHVTFTKVITATAAALATAGHVAVQTHTSATSQFAIVDMKVLKSTGLSGGGGDRLLTLSDGTIVFNNAGITAAVLGTPIYTVFGGTGNPLPVGAADVSTAGADLYLVYAGGTADFTTGSVQLAITLAQTAL